MGTEQEVLRIGKALERIAESDTPNEEQALDLLRLLQGLPMNLAILQKSRVGLSVNKLRKKVDDGKLSAIAKKLIKSWKKLVPGPPVKDAKHKLVPRTPSREDLSPPSPSLPSPSLPSPSPTSPSSASPFLHFSKPPSPPPVSYSPPSTSRDRADSNNSNITSPLLLNGEMYSMATASSDGVVLVFDPSMSGECRAPSTGSDIRDRCREFVIKALKKGFTEVSIEDDIRFFNLGAAIEHRVFSEFGDTGNKYKTRVRSRVANLGDLKNPGLRQNVISGHVPPDKIASMTTEEMASDEMKGLRKQFTKDSIRDAQMSVTGGTQTDLLKCPKCKGRKCTYTQAQTRSADEPMTTFAYCMDCGARWKFC